MSLDRFLNTRWISMILLLTVFSYFGMGAVKEDDQLRKKNTGQRSNGTVEEEIQRTGQPPVGDFRMADLSLMMREQVDFLLTPALLVQEAISDDIVLTYPEE